MTSSWKQRDVPPRPPYITRRRHQQGVARGDPKRCNRHDEQNMSHFERFSKCLCAMDYADTTLRDIEASEHSGKSSPRGEHEHSRIAVSTAHHQRRVRRSASRSQAPCAAAPGGDWPAAHARRCCRPRQPKAGRVRTRSPQRPPGEWKACADNSPDAVTAI